MRALEIDSAAGRVRVQLENTSSNLGRVLAVSASGPDGSSIPGAGFPLMPHSRRWTELEWRHSTPPERVAVRAAKFTFDTVLAATPAPRAPAPGPLPVLAADSAAAPAR